MPDTLNKEQRDQAALYALDALSDPERKQFEQLLESNPDLQAEVEEISAILTMTSTACEVKIPEHILAGQRNLLRGKIDQLEAAAATKSSLTSKLSDIWYNVNERLFIPRQPVWAVATYVMFAFMIGRLVFPTVSTVPVANIAADELNVMQLLESGTLSSKDIDIYQNNAQSVGFNLQARNDYSVEGDLDDESVRQILYYMLKNDNNPGKRLKAVNLISESQPVEEGRVVLISSLLTDPNPGVRLRAAKSLNSYKSDKTLREACIKVLFEDENEAVRMAALGILSNDPTEDIVPALQIVSRMDKNEFIRDQARYITDTFKGQIAVERIEDE